MTSNEYIWYDIHSLWYHTTLWHSHTLYSCHHTQDTCLLIQCCWVLTCSVLNIARLQYVFSQTHSMYDIIWILCDTTTSLYDITRLYTWHHIHTIADITPTVYDMTYTPLVNITAIVTMTRHLLCFWHYTKCIRHLTWWMNDNTMTVSDMTPNVTVYSNTLDWWHHTLCMYEITPTACMTP